MKYAQHDKNRLQFEKSPYLLQHAANPVDWFPWGTEAFAKAQQERKPIFLSIGYSTCHWCHVMERESFEDADVARLMNEVFIAIKVDREERPDLDNLYMTVCQMLTGSGGWPLTIIMTPEKKPFFAGTYFPKTSRFGRIGMLELIPRIQEAWMTQRAQAINTADQVIAELQELSLTATTSATAENVLNETVLQTAYQSLTRQFDAQYGGFGDAPKFPTPHSLMFLLRYGKRTGDAHALAMVEQTLQAMRRGGIYDHLGFGFHRYSTDAYWLLPHFEKMLYDQALLALAYLEAYQATHKAEYARTAQEIFTYVLRDMTTPESGFYSAEDADSEGEEGKFYLWSVADIRAVLDESDAALFLKLFNCADKGNFREQNSNLLTGENIVHLPQPVAELAAESGMTPDALHQRIEHIRQTLFTIREQRVRPHKDDKILTDWNGLMIAALAKGAQVLNEPRYAEAAARSAQFIMHTLRNPKDRLLHRYRDGEAAVPAHLDDYAFLIWGLLELYETTFEVAYLEQALTLNAELLQHFWDQEQGGFFFTADDAEDLPVRQKQVYDSAIPSGNSVALLNVLRLARMTANPDLEAKAVQITRLFLETIRKQPAAHTFFLLGVDFSLGPSQEVVLVGDHDAADTHALLQALRREFLPNKVVLLRPSNQEAPDILRFVPYVAPYTSLNDAATVYVCRNYACHLPTTEIAAMLAAFH